MTLINRAREAGHALQMIMTGSANVVVNYTFLQSQMYNGKCFEQVLYFLPVKYLPIDDRARGGNCTFALCVHCTVKHCMYLKLRLSSRLFTKTGLFMQPTKIKDTNIHGRRHRGGGGDDPPQTLQRLTLCLWAVRGKNRLQMVLVSHNRSAVAPSLVTFIVYAYCILKKKNICK